MVHSTLNFRPAGVMFGIANKTTPKCQRCSRTPSTKDVRSLFAAPLAHHERPQHTPTENTLHLKCAALNTCTNIQSQTLADIPENTHAAQRTRTHTHAHAHAHTHTCTCTHATLTRTHAHAHAHQCTWTLVTRTHRCAPIHTMTNSCTQTRDAHTPTHPYPDLRPPPTHTRNCTTTCSGPPT
jgi:hypothetical protein